MLHTKGAATVGFSDVGHKYNMGHPVIVVNGVWDSGMRDDELKPKWDVRWCN